MTAAPITDYILTDHAVRELRRRGLEKREIDEVLKIRANVGTCGQVAQSYSRKLNKMRLNTCLRVFVDIDRKPA